MGEYILRDTPSGFKTLVYREEGEIRIHSAHDPLVEAKRSVDSFKKGRASIIIVCGVGLGYHISILKKKFPECLIIALEKEDAVIKIVRDLYPENILGVSIASSKKDLSAIFEEIDITSVRGAATFYHRPSYLLFKEFYNDILMDMKDFLSSKVSDLLTRFEFEGKWFENMLRNIHHVFSSVPVQRIFGRFAGCAGVIVSAGPSLRKNVKQLASLSDRALIVCVDTALKAMERNHVSPHIVMTLDSQKHSLRHFLGIKDFTPALVADIVSCPRIIETYPGKKIISTTSKYYTDSGGELRRETTPMWEWLEETAGKIGDIQSGGSVATSAFDLLLNLGCSPIILIGQDLAYTGREIHCTGTHHNDDWLPRTSRFKNLETINQNVIRKRKIKYVPSFGGEGSVISDFVFDLYRTWFEDSAEKVKIPVINATGGGARIKNTQESSMENILKKIKKPVKSPAKILEDTLKDNGHKNHDAMLSEFDRATEGINRVKNLARRQIQDGSTSEDDLYRAMKDYNVEKIITPFLRKTAVYLDRHPDMDPEKAAILLITEIASAANKLLNLLELSKKNLRKIR